MGASNQRFRLNKPSVAADVIDGEAVIMNLTKGHVYSLTGVGAEFWLAIVGGSTVDELRDAAAAHYGIQRERISADLSSLVSQLVAEELIVPDAGTSSELPVFSAAAYEAPDLAVFNDIKDLLAIDPPLPDYKPVGGQ